MADTSYVNPEDDIETRKMIMIGDGSQENPFRPGYEDKSVTGDVVTKDEGPYGQEIRKPTVPSWVLPVGREGARETYWNIENEPDAEFLKYIQDRWISGDETYLPVDPQAKKKIRSVSCRRRTCKSNAQSRRI